MTFGSVDEFKKRLVKSAWVWRRQLKMDNWMNCQQN